MGRRSLSVERPPTADANSDAVWRRVRDLAEAHNSLPIAGSRLLTEEEGHKKNSGIVFEPAETKSIPHRLGRRAVGFYEVYGADVTSSAHVRLHTDAMPAGKSSDEYITVKATSAGRCFILVF